MMRIVKQAERKNVSDDDLGLIRNSGLFDEDFYRFSNPDLTDAGLDLLRHYAEFGWKEGRCPNKFFDPSWYLMKYPDVAHAKIEPLAHYIGNGSAEGRRPGPQFDPNYYRRKVGEAALAGREPLAHYLATGGSSDEGLDEYVDWIRRYDTIGNKGRRRIKVAVQAMRNPPLLSVLMPVYNTPETFLRAAIESVINQLYPFWELCIADDRSSEPHVRRVLDEYKAKDPRVKVVYRTVNGHISEASNSALDLATGEFVALLDHDDELSAHALFMVADLLIKEPDVALVYSDEDRIDAKGRRYNPYFKPDWNPELIFAQNFFCHLGVYRRSLIERIGRFRNEFVGSQDYDLVLRAQRTVDHNQIRHIPHILYHWRAIPGSTASNSDEAKPYARNSSLDAIADALETSGVRGTVEASPHAAFNRVKLSAPQPAPRVTIVMRCDNADGAYRTVQSVIDNTRYANFEIVLAHDSSIAASVIQLMVQLFQSKKIKVVSSPKTLNKAEARNLGADKAKGDFLCFLDCGIQISESGWLTELVSQLQKSKVGIVGAMIYSDDRSIKNAGYILDEELIAVSAYQGLRLSDHPDFGYFGRAVLVQNMSAVSGACMALSRRVFEDLNGFNSQELDVWYSDVDLCLRTAQIGYRVVWTPHAAVIDPGQNMGLGTSELPDRSTPTEYMRKAWAPILRSDPASNPNLRVSGSEFVLADPPRTTRPWNEHMLDEHTGNDMVDNYNVIAASGLFNSEWYLERNSDVSEAGIDPLEHYINYGSAEGRYPIPGFDPKFYRETYKDIGAIEPYAHYILHGAAEKRKPNPFSDQSAVERSSSESAAEKDGGKNRALLHYLTPELPNEGPFADARGVIIASGLFNFSWYLNQNPDVAAAGIDPLTHYLDVGWREGRSPNPGFDPVWYLGEYGDVAAAGIEPLGHYIRYGSVEGRRPNKSFDPTLYRAQFPAIIGSGVDPLAHALLTTASLTLHGANAKLTNLSVLTSGHTDSKKIVLASGLFNTSWYLSQNPDVQMAGVDPLEHYVNNGWREGRTPNPAFDPLWYREQNPDVAAADIDPLTHYILCGSIKGLRPNRLFDPVAYRNQHPEMGEIGIDPLAHYLLTNPKVFGSKGGSTHSDRLRLTNLPDLELPDFFELRGLIPSGPIAVVVHVYHPDTWEEMAASIKNISAPFDLFVSLVAGVSHTLEDAIKKDFQQARVFVFPQDRGRDIARFMAILQTGVLFRYELICKIHSKRSTYVADGDQWRRQLIDGILGSRELVDRIIARFRSDPDLGIVVADGNIFSGEECWAGNEDFLNKLLPRLSISTDYVSRSFPGGGMFWIRPLILRTLLGSGLNVNDFEPEPMPVNGALGHAVERMFGLICEDAGMKFVESSKIDDAILQAHQKDGASKIHAFALFLPQFHPIKENNLWWGEGFTEWTNVTRAAPMFSEHRQPRLPSDLGFYDLRLPEIRAAQAALARKHGITGFCYYYYWFNGRRILERPLDEILRLGEPENPFMICWANEPWSRNWDGLNHETLLPQTYEPGWEKLFAHDVAPVLKDDRYFKLDGRPMLLIYRARHIEDCRAAMDKLREEFVKRGVPNVHLCAGLVDFPNDEDLPDDPAEIGFDSYYEFPPHRAPAVLLTPRPTDAPEDSGIVFDYGRTVDSAVQKLKNPVVGRRHRGLMAGFDNTSRRGKRATIFHGATPTNFRRWLREIVLHERRQPGERVVFINAWNEWAEGTVLEPDRDFGRGWLEAVSSAMGD
ncbi:glycoside hydrolase family 99-like domain-containing protein [Azospirillum brasilense]|nr:glycoside hydrolase family 99-like domain-containing protein [Azospirillum brasilense]